ncbi:MAG: A24 family peptidase [Clostridia bacterium]|nr:A24 family peptidase [Clostridia bacterium]
MNKIPNWLTLPAITAGFICNGFINGPEGVVYSLQGLLLGVAIFVIPFAMGGIGGGDVKLMGAIGALKGWAFTLEAALLTAVWGGVIALLAIVITHRPTALRDLGKGLGFFVLTRGAIGSPIMVSDGTGPDRKRLAVPYGDGDFRWHSNGLLNRFENCGVGGRYMVNRTNHRNQLNPRRGTGSLCNR